VLRAVAEKGYAEPTPIQEMAIPHVLAGKDLLGCAQTGTGKTAAFALPMLQKLRPEPGAGREAASPGRRGRGSARRPVRALVLTPTRELATQIGESFREYGKHTGLRHTVVYGGVSQVPQEKALRDGVDILVATPGRLLDLLSQGLVSLADVGIFVLDEADRMLDMGFIHDIRRLVEPGGSPSSFPRRSPGTSGGWRTRSSAIRCRWRPARRRPPRAPSSTTSTSWKGPTSPGSWPTS
jgi:ATP-dependent RNA helicase RhlE